MEAQTPAEGITRMKSWPDSTSYKVPCECGCDNSVDFFIEVDDCSISATFCSTTKTNYWRERLELNYSGNWLALNTKMFLNDWYNRLAIAWEAIVHGYIRTESSVILTPQQVLNLSETLKTSIAEYEDIVEKRKASFAKSQDNETTV